MGRQARLQRRRTEPMAPNVSLDVDARPFEAARGVVGAPVEATQQEAPGAGAAHQFANISVFPTAAAHHHPLGEISNQLTWPAVATQLLRQPYGSEAPVGVGMDLATRIRTAAGSGGRPLEAEAQQTLEMGLGADLSAVRVHTDNVADQLAQAVDAAAFTTGPDIFFRAGHYDPASAAGMHLLAHEATHTVQQRGRQPTDPTMADAVSVSDPADAAEQTANHAATGVITGRPVRVDALTAADTPLEIQRAPTEVDLPFIGGGFFFSGKRGDDSSVTFNPWGTLGTSPFFTAFTDFPAASSGDVELSAGTSTVARLNVKVHIFEDNVFLNETMDQVFHVEWKVSATPDGKLTIESDPIVTVEEPSDYGIKAGLSAINPSSNGRDYVRVSPVISSAGGSAGLAPGGVGVTVNTPGQFVTEAFTLNIHVKNVARPKEPTGKVTIGPVSALRTTEVIFADPKTNNYKGVDTLSGDEQRKLLRFYNDLNKTTRDQLKTGAIPITLEAFASTTGTGPYNLDLAARRLENVKRTLRGLISDGVRFSAESRAPGEYEANTPDKTESDQQRKVVVSVWEQEFAGETSPGGTGP